MKDDDPTTNDKGDKVPEPEDGPIKPEVVRGVTGAGQYGRPLRTPRAARSGRSGRTVVIACVVLIVTGATGLVFGIGTVSNPAKTQCNVARSVVRTAVEDDKTDNDAGLQDYIDDHGAIDTEDCGVILAAANVVPGQREITQSALRTQGIVLTLFGLVQVGGGVAMARFRTRRARTIALVGAVLSVLVPVLVAFLGAVALVVPVVIVYGLYFSREAKEQFGPPTLGRRRQVPSPASDDEPDES